MNNRHSVRFTVREQGFSGRDAERRSGFAVAFLTTSVKEGWVIPCWQTHG